MRNRPLSVEAFKDWLSEQNDGKFVIGRENRSTSESIIGRTVRSKVSEKKILSKIEAECDAHDIGIDFFENGGTIIAVDGNRLMVETDGREFYIPRFCVKLIK